MTLQPIRAEDAVSPPDYKVWVRLDNDLVSEDVEASVSGFGALIETITRNRFREYLMRYESLTTGFDSIANLTDQTEDSTVERIWTVNGMTAEDRRRTIRVFCSQSLTALAAG